MVEPVPLLVSLDRNRRTPLHRQLYDEVREAILAGRLRPGSRIPASREMARELDLSRTTVLTAVQRLIAEGFLQTRVGAGTWVSPSVRDQLVGFPAGARGGEQDPASRPTSRRSRLLSELAADVPDFGERPAPFQVGLPALDAFPASQWARIAGRHWRAATSRDLAYGSRRGLRALREAIADYMSLSRGVVGDADCVLVTSGSQVGLTLAAQVMLDPGDVAWLEEPGYGGARGAVLAAGARVEAVPVDGDGLNVEAGARAAPDARLAYVTPSHQFPLGVTLSLERRLALLRWAEARGGWILEDDYDAEYRYEGRPLLSLQGLDGGRRVVYVGTFSKTLFPSVRLGFLVLPHELVDPFIAARYFLDHHPPIPHQAALADFIGGGHLARHVHRMRGLYRERRDALVGALGTHLSGLLDIAPTSAGLHLTAYFRDPVDDRAVEWSAREHGLGVLGLWSFYAGTPTRTGLVFGLGNTPTDDIEPAVVALASIIERTLMRTTPGGG